MYLSLHHKISISPLPGAASPPASTTIPCPNGLTYYPFQKDGIEFLLNNPRALLADQMRAGKTVQTCGLINTLGPKLQKILIVCPASARLNWIKEMDKWLVSGHSYAYASPSFYPRYTNIVVINYEGLKKYQGILKQERWDLIVADEAHNIKTPGAQRSKNFYSLNAPRVIMLTGTPIPNYPREIFPLVHHLRPTEFPSLKWFLNMFCANSTNGASNLPTLNQLLRSTVMLRRLRSEVMADLPPKIRQIIVLPAAGLGLDLDIKQELELFDSRLPLIQELRAAAKAAKTANDTQTYHDLIHKVRSTQGQVWSELAALRKKLAIKKAPLVIDHLHQCLENEQKVVVFAHHIELQNILHTAFPGVSVVHNGERSFNERERAVVEFKNNPLVKLFIGGMKTAGEGISLAASSLAVFAELDWTPKTVSQCEDRLLLLDKKDQNILVQHLVVEGSLDARIAQKLISKQQVIDDALDNQEEQEIEEWQQ